MIVMFMAEFLKYRRLGAESKVVAGCMMRIVLLFCCLVYEGEVVLVVVDAMLMLGGKGACYGLRAP